jgi:hypothetical protein
MRCTREKGASFSLSLRVFLVSARAHTHTQTQAQRRQHQGCAEHGDTKRHAHRHHGLHHSRALFAPAIPPDVARVRVGEQGVHVTTKL